MITDNEIKDCVYRHSDWLELKLRTPKVVHRPGCTRGQRQWRFSWKWPFVHTWISQAICMCEILQIEEMVATFEEVIPILRGLGYHLTPNVVNDMVDEVRRQVQAQPPEERQKMLNAMRKGSDD